MTNRVRTQFPILVNPEEIKDWANDLTEALNLFQTNLEERVKDNTGYATASAVGLTGTYASVVSTDIKASTGIVDTHFDCVASGAVYDFRIVRTDTSGDTVLKTITGIPIGPVSWTHRDIIPIDSAAVYKIEMRGTSATVDEIVIKSEEIK